MTYQASIGTISHGTLRSEDLLSAFADELERLDSADKPNRYLIDQARKCEADDADAMDIINELIDALNECAPPYCYFGTNEGDGSDFGFWPCMDQIEELPHIGDPGDHPINLAQAIVAAVNDSDAREASTLAYRLAENSAAIGEDCAFVNDHGNVTVYAADGSVIINFV